jgi:hypothetical protein
VKAEKKLTLKVLSKAELLALQVKLISRGGVSNIDKKERG